MEMFRVEAVKEADEVAALPIQLRSTALEKILRRLLIRGKSKDLTVFAENLPINTRLNINQRSQVNPLVC